MDEKIQKVWGKGTLKIYDVEIDCYVLMDGTPVLSRGKLNKALGRTRKSSRTDKPSFIGATNLQAFINKELEEKLKGIDFYDSGRLIKSYHADILPLVCNAYLEAREAGVLTVSQLPIAKTCEILLRSFSRVGITALVYESVGYEKYKHPEAFKLLIESYLAEEIRQWAKEFPDDFFYHMDRIYGNQRTTSKNRPQYYAKFIRRYVYEPIEKGFVLKELDKRNPMTDKGYRLNRFHQFMNEEKGLKVLRSQVWQILGLLKSSSNKRRFESNYARWSGKEYQGDLFEDQDIKITYKSV